MASTPIVKFVNGAVLYQNATPFIPGAHVNYNSAAGTTLYGANDIGEAGSSGATAGQNQVQVFKQTISGNTAFELPSASTFLTPQNTTGGALSDLNQLRVTLINETPFATVSTFTRIRGDNAPAANQFVVGAGGGTLAGDATMRVTGNQAIGATAIIIQSTGANTKTAIIGDKLTFAGDTTQYYVTDALDTANGVTGVTYNITPPLQVAIIAAQVVTFAAPSGKTLFINTAAALAVGSVLRATVFASTDVITITGGAMTAGREYDDVVYSYMFTSGACSVSQF
jgi:hypothetical protein